MNRIIKLNNYVNDISIKEFKINEFKINEFKINEIYNSEYQNIPINSKTCRYCLEKDDKEYISPCLCKGGLKYIHTDCLNQWREVNLFNPEKRNSCEICKYSYKFKRGDVEYFNKFLIDINGFYILYVIIIWITTLIVGCIEIATNFFIIRTLNFYNNSSLLILFENQRKNEDIFYITYTLFYFSLSSFFFEMYYAMKFYFKCNILFPNEHYKSMRCYMYRYNIQSFLFLYYYYFCLILNLSSFYIYSSIIITVINNIYRLHFYTKHNNKLKTVILNIGSTEEILSFEENPLLGILCGEKDQIDETAEFDESSSDRSNENEQKRIDIIN